MIEAIILLYLYFFGTVGIYIIKKSIQMNHLIVGSHSNPKFKNQILLVDGARDYRHELNKLGYNLMTVIRTI